MIAAQQWRAAAAGAFSSVLRVVCQPGDGAAQRLGDPRLRRISLPLAASTAFSAGPKRMRTGCGRGQRRSRGIASKVPRMNAGTAGTGCSLSSRPMPGRNRCSSPSGERQEPGNQISALPRARARCPMASVESGARSSTGKIWAMRQKRRAAGALGKEAAAITRPVQPAHQRQRQGRAQQRRVEIAQVVGDDDEGRTSRQMLQPLGLQPEEQPRQYPVDR